MTLEGKAKLFWSETSYIGLIALYVHPKNSKHVRPHSRAIVALYHSRLGLENKFLENKSGRIFLRLTGLLYKFLPTNLRVCKPTFHTLSVYHIWGEKVLFIIQSSDRMRHFTIFQDKLHLVNIQDDQSWAFSETFQKNSKITHTASRFSFLVRAVCVVECLNEL